MQGVFQALSKLLILWAEQRQNEIRPWRLYETLAKITAGDCLLYLLYPALGPVLCMNQRIVGVIYALQTGEQCFYSSYQALYFEWRTPD